MSWDIFVQDLPANARSIRDIPDDFKPQPIGSRDAIVAAIRDVFPEVDFTDPCWGRIETGGFGIRVNIGEEDPVMSLAFHVYGGGAPAELVAAILDRLGLRALDPGSETGFFACGTAEASFRQWQAYRDQVRRMAGPATE